MKTMRTDQKYLVGWKEHVDLPLWGITRLRAKVDSGARTSALHVEDLEILEDDSVRFHVILSRKRWHRRVEITAPVEKWARVRSSTGQYSRRCFVRTRIRIGRVEREIEISLVSREDMMFRMLLGRTALGKDFLIDAGRGYVLSEKARGSKKRP